jgi:hypothetical protein
MFERNLVRTGIGSAMLGGLPTLRTRALSAH